MTRQTKQDVGSGRPVPFWTRAFRELCDVSKDGLLVVDTRGRLREANPAFCSLVGYTRDELLGMSVVDIEANETREDVLKHIEHIIECGQDRFETVHRCKDGSTIEVEVTAHAVGFGDEHFLLVFVRDVVERKEAEHRADAGDALLKLFAYASSRKEYLDAVVALIRDWSGCRCVGVRVLDEWGNIPYESHVGFGHEFCDAENWLSLKEHQCICIRVIDGTLGPQDGPAVTPTGSFRCDDIMNYLGQLSSEERARFRGACPRSDFASLAVVPIRRGEKTLGAIHLADEREGHVPPKVVEFIESMTPIIGEAVYKFNVEDELQRNYEIQTAVNSLLRLSLEDIPVDELVKGALDIILSIPQLCFRSRGAIFLVEDEPEILVMKAQSGLPKQLQEGCARIPFGKCICGRAASTQKIQFSDCLDDRHEIRYEGIFHHGHYCVPIVFAGRTVGVIDVSLREGHRRNEREEALLTTVANVLAGIIERKRAEEELHESAKRLRRQNRTLAELASYKAPSSDDLCDTIRKITETAAHALETERVSVWTYSDDRSKIQCVDLYERSRDRHSRGVELIVAEYPAYFKALEEERAIVADDARADPRTKEFSESYLVPIGITSMLDAPVRLSGRVAAVVCHEHVGPPRRWTLEEQNFAGSIADLVALAMEASERRHAEQRYHELVDGLDAVVWEADARTWQLTFVSRYAEELLGYPLKRWLEPNFWADHIHPDDREDIIFLCKRATEEGRTHEFEHRMIAADGRAVWLRDVVTVELVDGRPTRLKGVMVDITEHKRAEEEQVRLQRRLEALWKIARMVDADHQTLCDHVMDEIIAMSQSRYAFYGFLSEDESVMTVYSWSRGAMADCQIREKLLEYNIAHSGIWADAVRQRKTLILNDYSAQHPGKKGTPDGHVSLTRILVVPIFGRRRIVALAAVANKPSPYTEGDAKQIEAFLTSVQVVMDRRQAEEEKENIQAQLIHIQKMDAIGTLAGGVAHDFNNILTAIRGYSDMALTDLAEDDPLYRNLNEIRRASISAANLTRQLLLFSRHQAVNFTPLSLNQIVSNLLKMLDRLIGEQFSITTHLAKDIPAINADAGHIEQVVMNLVVNAKDAMKDGGEIVIKTENVDVTESYCRTNSYARPGRFVRLSVEDQGIGMDSETMSRIFEPFFSTKRAGEGTGLGLSVVYGIVKRHDGWIDVDSRPGRGSTFSVYLPSIPTKPQQERQAAGSVKRYRGKGEKILLVEDEEAVRIVVERMLRENGYNVFAVSSAEDAHDVFMRESGDFQLVFSDLVLPGESGLKLAVRLLDRKPNLRVLFATGYSDETTDWQTIQERGYPFLQKPYALRDVLRVVKELLEGD